MILSPKLMALGRIKIGEKTGEKRTAESGREWRQPKKLDHFIITQNQRGADGNFVRDEAVMDALKTGAPKNGVKLDANRNIVGIPVRVLYNNPDLVFPTRFAAYDGRSCVCSSTDGQTAARLHKQPDGSFASEQVQCPCSWLTVPDDKGNRKCKPNGRLSVVITGMKQVGGCHVFHTTSYNTISSIGGSLVYIGHLTNGLLAGLDLQLIVRPQTVTNSAGKTNLVHIVSLIYPGDVDSLRNQARLEYQKETGWTQTMKKIEHSAKPFPEDGDGIAEEFYPESVSDEDQSNDSGDNPTVDEPVQQDGVVADAAEEPGPNVKNLIALQKIMPESVLNAVTFFNRDRDGDGNLTGDFPSEGWNEEQAGAILKWIEEKI